MCTGRGGRAKGREKSLQRIYRIVGTLRDLAHAPTVRRIHVGPRYVYALNARTLSIRHTHTPHLQLAPQHTQHRTHVNGLTRTRTITRLHISKTLNERHRNTIRAAHHVSRIHNQQQVTHRGHIRVTMRAHSISERRPRIAQNHTARFSVIELRRRKRVPRVIHHPAIYATRADSSP